MAKRIKKKAEKIAEMVGVRRPIAGSVLVFLGLMTLLSLLAYASGQEIFFKDALQSFFGSTQEAGRNLCGRIGATFSLLSIATFGVAAFMIPVYLIWAGALCFRRSVIGVGKLNVFSMFAGLFLLSMLVANLQYWSQNSCAVSAYFPAGMGGKFGSAIFENFLFPVFDNVGTFILVGTLYFICLIVVFVESPIEATVEIAGVAQKVPSISIRAIKFLWNVLIFPLKYLFNKIVERRVHAMYNAETIDNEILASPIVQNETVNGVAQNFPPATPAQPEQIQPQTQNIYAPISELPAEQFAQSRNDEIQNAQSDAASENARAFYPQIDLNEIEVQSSTGRTLDFAEDDDSTLQGRQPIFTANRFNDDSDDNEKIPQPNAYRTDEDEENNLDDEQIAPSKNSAQKKNDDEFFDENKSDGTLRVERFEAEKYDAPITAQKRGDYVFPAIDLLDKAPAIDPDKKEDYESRMKEIVRVIKEFKLTVLPDKVSSGPVITRYEVRPAAGVRVNKIAMLEDDIALGIMAEKVRVIAPIPGRGTVGIEVPNRIKEFVCMRDLLESKEWNESDAEIPIALGKDVTGKPMILNLAKMPHLLIAGTTGSGKSVCVNTIIVSLLYKMTPEDLRFIMVDPKVVELQIYNALPHMLVPVVTDLAKVPATLRWLISEMARRYKIFKYSEVRNIAGFNAKVLKDKEEQKRADELDAQLTPEERVATNTAISSSDDDSDEVEIPKEKLPYIVCIIDEFADLMMTSGKEVETSIARLTQLARAAGIHLIVATQRPSTDVITGLIKSNLPTRIALKVQSQIDSRTILDRKGAETLIGHGDMLYYPGGDFIRAQGAYLKDEEIDGIVEAIKINGEPQYVEEIQAQIDSALDDEDSDDDGDNSDPKLAEAISEIRASRKASTSFLQRRLGIGYGRAARIIDILEMQGKIGPDKGPGNPRDIYID